MIPSLQFVSPTAEQQRCWAGAHGGAGTAGLGAGVPLGKLRKTPDADLWLLIDAHAHAWAGIHERARAGSDSLLLLPSGHCGQNLVPGLMQVWIWCLETPQVLSTYLV